MTDFKTYVTGLPADELIKLAEETRQGFTTTVANIITPMLKKYAEAVREDAEAAVAARQAAAAGPEKIIQGDSDENDQKGKEAGVDQKALKEALKEALYTNNVNGLGTIIQTLDQQFGSEMATNAINLARTIMQEGLTSKDPATALTPEQVAAFAQAFEQFDGAMGNAPTSAQ